MGNCIISRAAPNYFKVVSIDINDIHDFFIGYINNNSHTPLGENGYLICIRSLQLFWSVNNGNNTFIRRYESGAWTGGAELMPTTVDCTSDVVFNTDIISGLVSNQSFFCRRRGSVVSVFIQANAVDTVNNFPGGYIFQLGSGFPQNCLPFQDISCVVNTNTHKGEFRCGIDDVGNAGMFSTIAYTGPAFMSGTYLYKG